MIVVSSLNKVASAVLQYRASHVASFLGSDMKMPAFETIKEKRHLKLSFNDISEPVDGFVLPAKRDVGMFVDFVRNWDKASPMVIHCWAGISRSTAGAFIGQCVLHPDEDEFIIAERLRKASPSATPNRMMVGLADSYLARGGRMRDAVASIGRGIDAFEGEVFHMPVK